MCYRTFSLRSTGTTGKKNKVKIAFFLLLNLFLPLDIILLSWYMEEWAIDSITIEYDLFYYLQSRYTKIHIFITYMDIYLSICLSIYLSIYLDCTPCPDRIPVSLHRVAGPRRAPSRAPAHHVREELRRGKHGLWRTHRRPLQVHSINQSINQSII